jgi:hypothetical protein
MRIVCRESQDLFPELRPVEALPELQRMRVTLCLLFIFRSLSPFLLYYVRSCILLWLRLVRSEPPKKAARPDASKLLEAAEVLLSALQQSGAGAAGAEIAATQPLEAVAHGKSCLLVL